MVAAAVAAAAAAALSYICICVCIYACGMQFASELIVMISFNL